MIAMDTIGYGESYKPAGRCDIEDYARGAVALLDGLGIASSAVVGHHTGAVIAMELAASHPDRVERLVLSVVPLRRLGRPRPAPAHGRASRRPRRGEAGRQPHRRALADPAAVLPEGPARSPDTLRRRRAPGGREDPGGPRRLQPVPHGGEDRPGALPDAGDVGNGGPVRGPAGRGGRPAHPREPHRADRRAARSRSWTRCRTPSPGWCWTSCAGRTGDRGAAAEPLVGSRSSSRPASFPIGSALFADDARFHAPRWLVGMVGGLFVLAGLLLSDRRAAAAAPPEPDVVGAGLGVLLTSGFTVLVGLGAPLLRRAEGVERCPGACRSGCSRRGSAAGLFYARWASACSSAWLTVFAWRQLYRALGAARSASPGPRRLE